MAKNKEEMVDLNIPVDKSVEKFIKEQPELANNLLMGSDKKLYVYFPVEEFMKIYHKGK